MWVVEERQVMEYGGLRELCRWWSMGWGVSQRASKRSVELKCSRPCGLFSFFLYGACRRGWTFGTIWTEGTDTSSGTRTWSGWRRFSLGTRSYYGVVFFWHCQWFLSSSLLLFFGGKGKKRKKKEKKRGRGKWNTKSQKFVTGFSGSRSPSHALRLVVVEKKKEREREMKF